MTDIHLLEAGTPVLCDLDQVVVERLVAAGVVTATPAGPGRWDLRAARKVGVARIGGTVVWIRPKVAVARLLWLLGWARRAVFDAPGPVSVADSPELVPVLAEAYCNLAERTLRTGLLQGYEEVDESASVMRGRLRSADQLRRRFGLAVPLLIRYDDYLVDIAENRILKAATSALLRLPGVAPRQLARLRQLRMILSDVTDLVPGDALPRWQPSRLNARYHDALWLAAIILAGGSVEQEPGLVRLDGFLVDLFQVFEDFVTASLSEALERFGGSCHAQESHSLDDDGAIDIRPDLVWRDRGQVVAVIDAKYKAEKPAGFPQADLYQALAYATAHDLDHAHLVYARGNEAAQTWTVRHAGVRITAHTLDLDAVAEDVLNQVSALAGQIEASVVPVEKVHLTMR